MSLSDPDQDIANRKNEKKSTNYNFVDWPSHYRIFTRQDYHCKK
jgi:hypothetical protein